MGRQRIPVTKIQTRRLNPDDGSRYVCVISAHLTKFIRTCFYFFQVVTFLLALDLRKISDPFRFVFVLLLVAMFLLSIIS